MPRVRSSSAMRNARRRARRAKPYKSRTVRRRTTRVSSSRGKRSKLVRSARKLVSYSGLVAPKIRTKLMYSDTKTVTPGTGMVNHLFRINSLYDPDHSGTGHQPAYHDQWAVLYREYSVYECVWSITFTPVQTSSNIIAQKQVHTGTTDTYPYVLRDTTRDRRIVFWELSDNTTFNYTQTSDKNILRELGNKQKNVAWAYCTDKPVTLRGRAKLKDVVSGYDESQNAAVFGNNPVDMAYIAVGAMSVDGNVVNDVLFDISMEFHADLGIPQAIEES